MGNNASLDTETFLYSADPKVEEWARVNFGDLIGHPAFEHPELRERFRSLVNDAYQANDSEYDPDMRRFGLLDIHGRSPDAAKRIAEKLLVINHAHNYLRGYVFELRAATSQSAN